MGSEDGQFNLLSRILLLTIPTLCCIYRIITTQLMVRSITHKSSAVISPTSRSSNKLKHPRAIAVDSGGVLYVSEWECDGVYLFSSQGEFVVSLCLDTVRLRVRLLDLLNRPETETKNFCSGKWGTAVAFTRSTAGSGSDKQPRTLLVQRENSITVMIIVFQFQRENSIM